MQLREAWQAWKKILEVLSGEHVVWHAQRVNESFVDMIEKVTDECQTDAAHVNGTDLQLNVVRRRTKCREKLDVRTVILNDAVESDDNHIVRVGTGFDQIVVTVVVGDGGGHRWDI